MIVKPDVGFQVLVDWWITKDADGGGGGGIPDGRPGGVRRRTRNVGRGGKGRIAAIMAEIAKVIQLHHGKGHEHSKRLAVDSDQRRVLTHSDRLGTAPPNNVPCGT